MPFLTTITPYWWRFSTLRAWLAAVEGALHPDVEHFLITSSTDPLPTIPSNVRVDRSIDTTNHGSIGYWHNHGAKLATSEWIMKLDVDTIPNVRFFKELLPILQSAKPHEWFDCGMFYANQKVSQLALSEHSMPLSEEAYNQLVSNRAAWSDSAYIMPAATNFICRREDYLQLGGCVEGFNGYGWEDYQQIYMLERWQRGMDPLPGDVHIRNVTQRCRDEISRPKAKELWERNPYLCLLHRWHARAEKDRVAMESNRHVLLDYILQKRLENYATIEVG